MSLVLNTGSYHPLMETRRMVLEQAGHIVVSAMAADIVIVCEQHRFDVAVIGQCVPPHLKREFFSLIRRHCASAKILELITTGTAATLEHADSWLQLQPWESVALAQRVAELTNSNTKKSEAWPGF